jgi:DNA-binding response OmpR family regulator
MDVLLIDPDPVYCDIITRFLGRNGIKTSCVEHGQAALTMLQQLDQQPRLIMLAIGMPVIDGWAFRMLQLQDPTIARIPVIFTSGDDSSDRVRAQELGGWYLPKPSAQSVILALVNQLLQRLRAE